jgi:hypothetical protein
MQGFCFYSQCKYYASAVDANCRMADAGWREEMADIRQIAALGA